MDNQMIIQMMQGHLPSDFQKVSEVQQLVLSHAARGGKGWQVEMLKAIRPKLPVQNRYMADILIKCMELVLLIEEGCEHNGHRSAV